MGFLGDYEGDQRQAHAHEHDLGIANLARGGGHH
jgi:hypothetical protein